MVAIKRKKRYREEKEEERERVEVPDGNKSQSGRQAQQSIKLSSLMQCIKKDPILYIQTSPNNQDQEFPTGS